MGGIPLLGMGKPKPGDQDPSGLSKRDKWLMLAAALRNDSESMQNIPLMAAQRAKLARQQGLEAEFGSVLSGEGVPMLARQPVAPAKAADAPPMRADPMAALGGRLRASGGLGDDVPMLEAPEIDLPESVSTFSRGPGRKGPLTMRDALPILAKMAQAGIPIKDRIDLIEKSQPDIGYERGVRYDKRDPSSAPAEIFDVEKGQRRVYDADGRAIGVMNAEGYVQSLADVERAKTRASEEEKARLDIGKYDLPDGSTQQIPRLKAAEAFGAVDGVPTRGGRPTATGLPGGLGRSQTPADKVRAEGAAKTDVEIAALTPKARSTLDVLNRKSDFILETLRKARGQVKGGIGGTAGLNSLTAIIPGTASRDLDATLDTLRANLGFGELSDMRQNSPTGGALGSLTVRELDLLAALIGSLDQGQAPDQLAGNLDRMILELEKVTKERRSAFDRQYGGARSPATGATKGGTYSPEDRARAAEILRQRRAERGT